MAYHMNGLQDTVHGQGHPWERRNTRDKVWILRCGNKVQAHLFSTCNILREETHLTTNQ